MISHMSLTPSQIKSQVRLVRFGSSCMIVMISLATLAFGGFAYFDYNRGMESFNWTPMDAEILESYVDKDDEIGPANYRPIIVYEYIVGGQTYTSDNFQYGDSGSYTSDREPADTRVSQYPTSEIITIFYNPQEPYRSVIIQGPTPKPLRIMIGMGIAELVCIGLFFVISRKTKQQHKRLLADPSLGLDNTLTSMTGNQSRHEGYSKKDDFSS